MAVWRAMRLARLGQAVRVLTGLGAGARAGIAAGILAGSAACASPTVGEDAPDARVADAAPALPDAAPVDVDAGFADAAPGDDAAVLDSGFVLARSSLAPATAGSATPTHQLRGNLRSTAALTSSTAAHRLRGGLLPQAR